MDAKENRQPINIEEEMRRSYVDYAMSVIIGRALPDVRDGLKPVHRRVLYAMYDTGNSSDKPYRKSARTVGTVIGKYHPHGDSAVYDALVRMAQDWSLRYLLIDGQRILIAISDPFNKGWNLFGTAFHEPTGAWLPPGLVWTVQLAAVVGGHMLGAWGGHVVAAADAPPLSAWLPRSCSPSPPAGSAGVPNRRRTERRRASPACSPTSLAKRPRAAMRSRA